MQRRSFLKGFLVLPGIFSIPFPSKAVASPKEKQETAPFNVIANMTPPSDSYVTKAYVDQMAENLRYWAENLRYWAEPVATFEELDTLKNPEHNESRYVESKGVFAHYDSTLKSWYTA